MSSSHLYTSATKDGSRPFGIPWMDSCYQETLLSGSMWQPVSNVQGGKFSCIIYIYIYYVK